MPAAHRPQAVAVDVVETLVSLDAVAVALEEHGLGPDTGERLFTRLLRDGFALAASGAYRPFRDVADGALAAVAPALAREQRDAVLAAFSRLDAHPDARPALERLRRAGLAVAALSNGAEATTTALLERTSCENCGDQLVDEGRCASDAVPRHDLSSRRRPTSQFSR